MTPPNFQPILRSIDEYVAFARLCTVEVQFKGRLAGHWYPAEIVDMDVDGNQVFVKTHPRSQVLQAAKVRPVEQPESAELEQVTA